MIWVFVINNIMATDNFIQSVKDAAKDKPQSIEWYRNKIREFGKPGGLDLIRDGKRVNTASLTNLNMFFYDPKYKKTLPYYDTFPLVLPLRRYNDGFLGLNFHYLPIPLRIKLLNKIYDLPESNQYDENARMRMSYARAQTMPMAKAVMKRYLYSHLKSQIRVVTPEEWVIATLLPVQRFKKASASRVYNETKKMI
jgi:hypothetical protein|tara:strand:- start:2 stop:589 length:588 start_codon:yes stop_codon:yes gene_type:complete